MRDKYNGTLAPYLPPAPPTAAGLVDERIHRESVHDEAHRAFLALYDSSANFRKAVLSVNASTSLTGSTAGDDWEIATMIKDLATKQAGYPQCKTAEVTKADIWRSVRAVVIARRIKSLRRKTRREKAIAAMIADQSRRQAEASAEQPPPADGSESPASEQPSA